MSPSLEQSSGPRLAAVQKPPNTPGGRGTTPPGGAHPGAGAPPELGSPSDRAHLPHPRRRARPGEGSGERGAGRCPPAPALSAPSPRQGAAERRQGAAQAAGAAGHGAAAQAVALQAPRQPLPHQDGEDSAGPRLPDDPGAGKEGNPLPPTPNAALRRFVDGRDGDSICKSSSVS